MQPQTMRCFKFVSRGVFCTWVSAGIACSEGGAESGSARVVQELEVQSVVQGSVVQEALGFMTATCLAVVPDRTPVSPQDD